MSDYSFNTDFDKLIRVLRQSAVGAPVELQLVWMAELLSILLLKNRDNPTSCIIKQTGYWRITHGATPSLASTVGLQHKTVSLLLKFRDAFVHNGSIAAVQLQLQLLSLPQKELDTLQEITGVKLNIGRSLL